MVAAGKDDETRGAWWSGGTVVGVLGWYVVILVGLDALGKQPREGVVHLGVGWC
jgi:hypothetical protein